MSFTIPNILTFFRLLAAPCVAIILIMDLNASVALFIFLLAAITDYFDGYLARVLNQSTSLGKVLDPIADKAMIIIILCCLNYSFQDDISKIFFGLPATAIIFREVFISGLREFIGKKSNLLTVTALSKWKTGFQMSAVGVILAGNVEYFDASALPKLGLVLLWIAALITLITGIDYFKKSLKELRG